MACFRFVVAWKEFDLPTSVRPVVFLEVCWGVQWMRVDVHSVSEFGDDVCGVVRSGQPQLRPCLSLKGLLKRKTL